MKKRLFTILLVLLFASSAMFAATDSFDITTSVGDIGYIAVTSEPSTTPTATAFNALDLYGDLAISTSGSQTFTAYMSILSNSRSGFTVSMDATPMKSTIASVDSYIDYSVTVNSTTLTTTSATPVAGVTILTVTSLAAMATHSHAIALSIDATTFDAAVSGSYTGTVTFTYAAT